MNTFSVNLIDFVLGNLRVSESQISSQQWWQIIGEVLKSAKSHLPQLLGYSVLGEKVRHGIKNAHITKNPEEFGYTLRCFDAFEDVMRADSSGGEAYHLLFTYDAEFIIWHESYRLDPVSGDFQKSTKSKTLLTSDLSRLTGDIFDEWSRRLWCARKGVLGYQILVQIASLFKMTVEEKTKRLQQLSDASRTLDGIVSRIIH